MKSLKTTAMDHANFVRLQMVATVPPGTTIEDILEPSYWVNHAHRLKPGALIEVLSEDNVLDCELRVLETGPTFAKVRVIRQFVEPAAKPQAKPATNEAVTVDYGGKNDRWRVMHRGEVIKSGLATEAAAVEAAEEYRGKIAA